MRGAGQSGRRQGHGRQAETRPVGPGLRGRAARLRDSGRLRAGQLDRGRLRRTPALSHAHPHGHDDHEERARAAPVPGDRRATRAVPGGRAVPGRGAQAVPGGRAQALPGGRRPAVPGARGQAVPGARAPAVRRARGQARRRAVHAFVPRARRRPPQTVPVAAAAHPQTAVLRPRPLVSVPIVAPPAVRKYIFFVVLTTTSTAVSRDEYNSKNIIIIHRQLVIVQNYISRTNRSFLKK